MGLNHLDIRVQTAAVLRNLDAIIKAATGNTTGLSHIIDATVFLVDMEQHYSGMNEEWNRVWPNPLTAPARTTVGVRELPRPELIVELKCTVVVQAG